MLRGSTLENFIAFLGMIRNNFDYLVVDTSSYISEVVLAALDQANLIITVVNQKIPSVRAASSFLRLSEKLNYPKDKIMLLVNQYDKNLWPNDKAIGDRLDHPISGILPEDAKLTIEAGNLGQPILLENPDLAIGKAILSFAAVVSKYFDKMQETA